MSKLFYKIFEAAGGRRTPVTLVFLHGLLGSHRNFTAVCKELAQPSEGGACAFTSVALDLRNHGDSFHDEHSIPLMVRDVAHFLEDIESRHEIVVDDERKRPPIVLVGHSMGGTVVMRYLWMVHSAAWKIRRGIPLSVEDDIIEANGGWQKHPPVPLRVSGAIVIDQYPGPRPSSFQKMADAASFLPQIPLQTFHKLSDVERWLYANGPRDIFNESNAWSIRFWLTNIDTTAVPWRWRCGLDEIVRSLHGLKWSDATLCDPESGVYVDSGSKGLSAPEGLVRVAAMRHPPILFVFGENSPYNSDEARHAISEYFPAASQVVIPGGTHFMFMNQRAAFVSEIRKWLTSLPFGPDA